jgi:exosome complex RNA-binding protein Csl4
MLYIENMVKITHKKIPFKISKSLRSYLVEYERERKMPLSYYDLTRYQSSIPLYDKEGKDTFWVSVFYASEDMNDIYYGLKKIYAILKANGDLNVMKHLNVDRIDLCLYGNSQPFRVRIVNRINDNFDYFYIKNADASRIYGLELEHILSPNHTNYYTDGDTLIEEHIVGIPGDLFIKKHLQDPGLNKIRLAKEFVKFNERCFVRLLGDMHSSNYVVAITQDFEEVEYRIRATDFDQQSYEGKKLVYMPQYFKQNNPIVKIGMEVLTPETVAQYQKEERSMMAMRMKTSRYRIKGLGEAVLKDQISTNENVEKLKEELAEHYQDQKFLRCGSMGAIIRYSLRRLLERR